MQTNSLAQAIERISLSILLTETAYEMAQADTDAVIADIVRG